MVIMMAIVLEGLGRAVAVAQEELSDPIVLTTAGKGLSDGMNVS